MSIRIARVLSLTQQRSLTTSSRRADTSSFGNRWLSDIRSRVNKCKAAQDEEASDILRILSQEWRELLAGSEGFLVGKERAGLERHQVVWGEMVGHVWSEP